MVLGQVGACKGCWITCLVAVDTHGVGSYVKLDPEDLGRWSFLQIAVGKQGVVASYRLEPVNQVVGASISWS